MAKVKSPHFLSSFTTICH